MKKKAPALTDPGVRWRDATATIRDTVKTSATKARPGLIVTDYVQPESPEGFIEHNVDVAERVLELAGLWPHPELGRSALAAKAVHNSFPDADDSYENFAAAIVWYGKTTLEQIAKNHARAAVDAAMQMVHFVYLYKFKSLEKPAVVGAAVLSRSKRKPADVERKQQVLRALRASHPDWREKAILAEAHTILSAEGVQGVRPHTLRKLKK